MLRTFSILFLSLLTASLSSLTGFCEDGGLSRTRSAPNISKVPVADITQSSKPARSVSVSLADTLNDYLLFEAEPVSGTEWVISVVFADEQEWTLLGNLIFSPGAESVSYTGTRSFKYESAARSEAEYLYEAGIIDAYEVYERPKQPTWWYVDMFDTLEEAQTAAEIIEATSNRITLIDAISVEPFTQQQLNWSVY